MDKLRRIPQQKQLLLQSLVDQLKRIPGMAAIVLGGSYAAGTQREGSDFDIGLYYFEAQPFSIAAVRQVADGVSSDRPATVTGFYGWGPWVNGGAWIHTAQGKVDFVYRSVDHVRRTIAEAQEGIHYHDYDQQPTYGFYSVIYLAETQICIPLHDPDRLIGQLKKQVATYPPNLQKRIIADSLWSAEFTLLQARPFAAQGDIYNVVGCLTRVASNLVQALFALNEKYFIRDKQVLDVVAGFSRLPPGFTQQINRILAHAGSGAEELTAAVTDLEQVWRSVVALAGPCHESKFQM